MGYCNLASKQWLSVKTWTVRTDSRHNQIKGGCKNIIT